MLSENIYALFENANASTYSGPLNDIVQQSMPFENISAVSENANTSMYSGNFVFPNTNRQQNMPLENILVLQVF
ncbi:20806_t:CDS:2 [Dentiscutata erythropus]|uniref:20806_t:CDS:1 n=1 Tax=Dentiscutata erythropus TaxID=1348616 RepID=A0A9N9CIL1_9GLOM|nr:20806_t:CDS:2 [Dentiscutata erythropus]